MIELRMDAFKAWAWDSQCLLEVDSKGVRHGQTKMKNFSELFFFLQVLFGALWICGNRVQTVLYHWLLHPLRSAFCIFCYLLNWQERLQEVKKREQTQAKKQPGSPAMGGAVMVW